MQMIIKELKVPLQYPRTMESRFSFWLLAWYRSFSKYSLVKDLTDIIPLRDSSTITLFAAVTSWTSLDFLRINLPKSRAMMMIAGNVASIITANFEEVTKSTTTPPIRIRIWRINIAKLVVKASWIWATSAEKRLSNSPTRFWLWKFMFWPMTLLKRSVRRPYVMSSVTRT